MRTPSFCRRSFPAEILHTVARDYQENPWADQKYQPYVFVEKFALVGVIEPECARWRVPYMALRGYPSHSELYSAGKRFGNPCDEGYEPVVFHLGDHDPSGLDMTRALREDLGTYARFPVRVDRLGLNLDQVRALCLPPNPAKESDRRYSQYVADTGCTDSWELDALSPEFIGQLIHDAIAALVDQAAWHAAIGQEAINRKELRNLASRFQGEQPW